MLRTTTLVTIAFLAAALLAQAQQPPAPTAGGRGAPQPQAIQQVKSGLYMITGAGGNTTGYAGSRTDSKLVVGTPLLDRYLTS